jgi:hypothetical protein
MRKYFFFLMMVGCSAGMNTFRDGDDGGLDAQPGDAMVDDGAAGDAAADGGDADPIGDAGSDSMGATCPITGYQGCDSGTECLNDEGGSGCFVPGSEDASVEYTACKNAMGNPPYKTGVILSCQSQGDCLAEGNPSTVFCCVGVNSYTAGCPGTFAPWDMALCYNLYSGVEGSCSAKIGVGFVQACKTDAECNEGDGGHCAPVTATNLPAAAGIVFGVCE